jgi:predicted nucleic acid-binding protein
LHRLFLDANILFSAAYQEGSPLVRLWKLQGAELSTSAYAMDEARRNLDSDVQRGRLERLAASLRFVQEGPLLVGIAEQLRAKDAPILAAAVASGATHLLTLDRRDFGRFFGQRVGGVLILHPRDYSPAT